MAISRTLLALLVGLTLGLPAVAQACSCAPRSDPLEELAEAGQVFRGTVLATEPSGEPNSLARTAVDFRVLEVWKGEPLPLLRVHTPGSSATCGRSFERGLEYLVYVERSGDVVLCSRTAPVASATADLMALGSGEVPEPASVGLLARHAVVAGAWYRPEAPGEGVFIELLADGSAALYWFGFQPASGDAVPAQRWLFGVGGFSAQTLEVESLQRLVGEGFAADYDAATLHAEQVGRLRMEFHGGGRASLHYRLDELGGTPLQLELERLTRPPAALPPLPR